MNISQAKIMKKIAKFLSVNGQKKESKKYKKSNGMCHGFAVTYGAMNAIGKLDWWLDVLNQISQYDSEENNPEDQILIKGSNDKASWDQIFTRAINYISFTFDPSEYINNVAKQQMFDEVPLLEIINEKGEHLSVVDSCNLAGHFYDGNIIKNLLQASLTPNEIVLVSNSGHTIAARYKDKKYFVYDPNSRNGHKEYDKIDDLYQGIQAALGHNIPLNISYASLYSSEKVKALQQLYLESIDIQNFDDGKSNEGLILAAKAMKANEFRLLMEHLYKKHHDAFINMLCQPDSMAILYFKDSAFLAPLLSKESVENIQNLDSIITQLFSEANKDRYKDLNNSFIDELDKLGAMTKFSQYLLPIKDHVNEKNKGKIECYYQISQSFNNKEPDKISEYLKENDYMASIAMCGALKKFFDDKPYPECLMSEYANNLIEKMKYTGQITVIQSCFPELLSNLAVYANQNSSIIIAKSIEECIEDEDTSVDTKNNLRNTLLLNKEERLLIEYLIPNTAFTETLNSHEINYKKDWLTIKDNHYLQQAVDAINTTGQFDNRVWNQLKDKPALCMSVIDRNINPSIREFRNNLNEFENEINNIDLSKRTAANEFVKQSKKADKAFLLYGSDSPEYTNALKDVKKAIEPLKNHRDGPLRIALTVAASLTLVGALIGGIQAGVQKFRGKHPSYLFMTMTKSEMKAEKAISSSPAA